jgi:hypothetical protein
MNEKNIPLYDTERKKKGRPKKIIITQDNLVIENVIVKKRGRKPNPKQSPSNDTNIVKKRGRKPIASFYNTLSTPFDKNSILPVHNTYKDILQLETDVLETDTIFHEDSLGNVLGNYVFNNEVSVPEEFELPLNSSNYTCDKFALFTKESNDKIKYDASDVKKIEDLYLSKINTRLEEDLRLIDEKKDIFLLDFNENQNILYGNDKENTSELTFNYDIDTKSYQLSQSNMEKSSIACYWCCHSFNTIPLGLPVFFNKNLNKFRVKYIFCSCNCILAYNNDYKLKYNNLIKNMYKLISGPTNFINEIPYKPELIPALPRQMLNLFGGPYSIDQFRENHNNYTYKLIEYPFYPSRDYIQELNVNKVKELNSEVFNTSLPINNDTVKCKEKLSISSFLIYDD